MTIRTINNVRNPVWSNPEHTAVDLEVDFDEEDEEYVPFTASPNDSEAYGVELYNNAIAGNYGPIGDKPLPEDIVGDAAMEQLRIERTNLLTQTDYIEMPTKWATLTSDQQAEWAAYRNALRDLPANYPNPEIRWDIDFSRAVWHNVTWPTKPQ